VSTPDEQAKQLADDLERAAWAAMSLRDQLVKERARRQEAEARLQQAVDASQLAADVLERTVWAAMSLRDQLVEERAHRQEAEARLQAAEGHVAGLKVAQTDAGAERAERIAALERSLDDIRLAVRALEPAENTPEPSTPSEPDGGAAAAS
jgi:hypothetical protein